MEASIKRYHNQIIDMSFKEISQLDLLNFLLKDLIIDYK